MKKVLCFLVLCLSIQLTSSAQCTPVDCPGAPSLFSFGGICSTDIPVGLVNSPYVESTSFRITNACFNPTDFDPTLPNLTIRLLNIRNFTFSGLPTGVVAQTNATIYTTGSTPVVGCVSVSGTPTTAGLFAAGIDVTAKVRSWLIGGCDGLIPVDVDQPFSFSLDVVVLPDPTFIGLAGSYTTADAPVTMTPTGTTGGAFSGPGVSGSTFDPSVAGVGTHEIIYTVTAQEGLAVGPATNADTMIVNVTAAGCPPGFVFNETSGLCEECPAGTFENGGVCSTCPTGTVSSPGATECTSCGAGTEPDATQTTCSTCPGGTYSADGLQCLPCATGEVSGPGAPNCASCPDGSTANANQDGCDDCQPGTFGTGGQCFPCAAGLYSDSPAATFCLTCPPGSQANATQTGCVPCPGGSYSDGSGSGCLPCPTGEVSDAGASSCAPCADGSTANANQDGCDDCQPGTFGTGGQCFPCAAGQYSDSPAATNCLTCPEGTEVNATQTGCIPCPGGSYSDGTGSGCLPCPTGEVSDAGATSCAPCADGSTANTTQDGCDDCLEGFYGVGGQCLPCAAGEYNDVPGATICKICPPGTTSGEGAVECIAFCTADTVNISAVGCVLGTGGTTDTTYLTNQGGCDSLIITTFFDDIVAPTALCTDITVYLDMNGNASVLPSMVDNGSNDECGVALSVSPSVLTCSHLGATTVTLGALDPSFNYSSCVANVAVLDTMPPVLTCTSVQAYSGIASCEQFVSVTSPLVVDNCDDEDTIPTITGMSTPGIFITDTILGAFDQMQLSVPFGSTIISMTVDVDISHTWVSDIDVGFISPTGRFVTLLSRPVNCNNDNMLITFDDAATLTAAQLDNWCMGTNPWYSGDARPLTPLSTLAGDSVNGFWVLYVQDFAANDNGTLNSWGMTIKYNDPNGRMMEARYSRDLKAEYQFEYDLASAASRSYEEKRQANSNHPSFRGVVTLINDFNGTSDASGVYPVGTTSVVWTATDESGNTATCTQDIVVTDTIPPTALCSDITVQLDASGQAGITVNDIDNSSSDACGLAGTSLSQNTFTCADSGANTVTLTVIDVNDNQSTCDATVTVTDPLGSCCSNTQVISLSAGWNLISAYIQPDQPDMLDVLESIISEVILVKDANGNVVVPSVPFNQIGNWQVTQGYQLKSESDTSYVMGCTKVLPELTPISLPAGWSIVSYLRDDAMDVEVALASLGDTLIIAKDNGGNVYFPSIPLNIIGNMLPGQGYQVKLSEPATLLYPANTVRVAAPGTYVAPAVPSRYRFEGNTGNNATIIIPEGVLKGINVGDEIGVFNSRDQLVGSAVYENRSMAIAVWGNEDPAADGSFMSGGEPYRFSVSPANGDPVRELWVEYSSGQPFYSVNGISVVAKGQFRSGSALPASLTAYPNPASDLLYLDIRMNSSSDIVLNVFDLTGQTVLAPMKRFLADGQSILELDISTLATGEYFFRMETKGEIFNGAFVKME